MVRCPFFSLIIENWNLFWDRNTSVDVAQIAEMLTH
jgi:hypothetical protein